MKLCAFISRLQWLNTYLEEFPPATEGQKTAPLPADEIMEKIYYSMLTAWTKTMIEQVFNYADSIVKKLTDLFETRVENLKPEEDMKNLQQLPRNPRIRKSTRKGNKQTLTTVS